MKKVLSSALALIVVLSIAFSVPASVYAGSMSAKCKTTIYTHNTTKLKVKVGSKKVSNSDCNFYTSNKKVATVSSSGYVKGVKAGTATITIRLKSNRSKYCKISIRVKKNYLTTPKSTIPFAKGSRNKLVVYYKGKRAGSGTVYFKSSNYSVATVDKNGYVKGIKAGTAKIKVKLKSNTRMFRIITIKVINSKTYTIKPGSAPLNGKFLNFSSTYNSYSDDYYALRSYMEYFEKHGGGTVKLLKGTYVLSGTVCIPSNTTIKLSDGATIKKTAKTSSSSSNNAPGTGFMFVAPSKANVSGAYSKYNGVHDSGIVGTGTATIDYKKAPVGSIGCTIVMCHSKNIKITGITFTNLRYGHFIEMDASCDVLVKNCNFKNEIHDEYNSSSECINIDTPDKQTDGFHQTWTSYDKTPNKNVTISYCKFTNVQRGLGTHQYSGDKYHTNINISNCSFTKCFNGGIGIMNWKDSVIQNNTFNGIGKDTYGNVLNTEFITHVRGLFVAGSSGLVIKNNSFKNLYECIRLFPKENKGYPISYNHFSDDEIRSFAEDNTYSGSHVDRPYVMVYAGTKDGNSTDFQYKLELTKK